MARKFVVFDDEVARFGVAIRYRDREREKFFRPRRFDLARVRRERLRAHDREGRRGA